MIGVFVSLLAGGLAAQAQIQTQAAPPAPPPIVIVPPAQPVPADPARLAAAERLLGATHIDQQYDAVLTRMIPVITVQMFSSLKENVAVPAAVRTHLAEPENAAQAERIFAEEAMKGFKGQYAAMRTATAREYAAVFTTDELNQLIAFYASPIGQKSLAVQPELQNKLMPIGMAAGRDVGRGAMLRTLDRLNLMPKKPAA